MHRIVKSYGLRRMLSQEAPSGLVAFLVAEFFYKFHSFALECLAFLATWYMFSLLSSVGWQRIPQWLAKRKVVE